MDNNTTETDKSFKTRLFKIFPPVTLIGIVLGAIGGYIYYIEIGCASGTCPLTSNPWTSVLWGAVIGYLFGDIFRKKPKAATETREK